MQLIYISTSRIPGEKANTYQVLQMCDAFSGLHVDIILLHPKRINLPPLNQVKSIKQYYGLKNNFYIYSLPALDLLYLSNRLFSNVPKLLNLFNVFSFKLLIWTYFFSLLFYLRNQSADFYYCRDLIIIQRLVKIYPKLTSKIIYEAHVLPKSFEEKKMKNLINRIRGLITTNKSKWDFFLNIGISSEKMLIAPNGVDLDRFINLKKEKSEIRTFLSLPKDRIIVGFVGQLEPLGKERGITQLIESIYLLKMDYPRMKISLCCVGGRDEIRLKYQLIARKFKLNAMEAIFVRHVSPMKIPQYLSAFDICVLPFPRNKYYGYEVSPLKLFEYMASKRVILAPKLPSILEILSHKKNAYLVETNSATKLAGGIRWLITHHDQTQYFAEQAWKDVQNYSWELRAEKILSFLE